MFTGFESLAGSPRGRAERDAPNRLLSSCHTEEIEILTTQARGLKEEEEESPNRKSVFVFFCIRKEERKEGREGVECSSHGIGSAADHELLR